MTSALAQVLWGAIRFNCTYNLSQDGYGCELLVCPPSPPHLLCRNDESGHCRSVPQPFFDRQTEADKVRPLAFGSVYDVEALAEVHGDKAHHKHRSLFVEGISHCSSCREGGHLTIRTCQVPWHHQPAPCASREPSYSAPSPRTPPIEHATRPGWE